MSRDLEPLKVGHHPAKFGSKDIMVLVCHVISQDYVTKGSSNWVGVPLRQVAILLSLVVIGSLVLEIVISLSRDLARLGNQMKRLFKVLFKKLHRKNF